MSASAIKHDNYETGKIRLLFQTIEHAFKTDNKQDYEISVDGYKVVPRTNDPERFNDYEEFVNADTENISVKMFKGNSASNDKFFFHIKGVPQKTETLQGIPDGMTVSEWEAKQKEKILRDIRYDELEKENAELREEVAEKDNTIAELTQNVELAKQGRLSSMSEIGMGILEKIIKSPKMQEQFPVLRGFAGVSSEEGNPNNSAEQNAGFKRKGETENETKEVVELTESERRYLMLVRDLQKYLSPFQLTGVMQIIDMLTQYPIVIGSTQKHIHSFLVAKHKEQETETKKEEN
ncbi:MAG TPA: hypothetical protein VN698_06160 [Bacteroidia bacterium]|nr:hypothetical protein [Bacteroidia bacterium]